MTGFFRPGSRGDRYQVVVHVDAEVLAASGEAGADGRVLDVGRRTRTISPGLRRALEHRDGG